MSSNFEKINIDMTIQAPVEKVWECWNQPEHIMQWCFASPDWHCPSAQGDLRVGGQFSSRMEAKDGSFGFDFGGTFTEFNPTSRLAYVMGDERSVEVDFKRTGSSTVIYQTFDAENTNPIEMQRGGWLAILQNFKNYVESLG